MFRRDSKLRMILMAAFAVLGLAGVIFGWTLTGKMSGLLIMIAGLILLLTALFLYNTPYGKERKKKVKVKK